MKNSPKFLIYIALFLAFTTAILLLITNPASELIDSIALIISDNFPTPDGSIIIRSGLYVSITSNKDFSKSPTNEQHIHPEFISLISIPASFKNPLSTPISPNSFSINTTFSQANTSLINFLIKVVLPAPKNPDMISIFIIFSSNFLYFSI